MSEDPDLAYGEVNQRIAEAVVAMENQSNENLRELGPLFNETDNQLQGRRTEPSKGRPGNKPTRTFVWLPHENAEDFSSLPSSKVKFPKELKGENLLALLKREKREIPQNCRSLNFFKSQSAGNHALFKVGSDLSGREVVENFKSTSTRVYLAERLPRVNVPVTFVPEQQINNTQAIIVPTNTGQQSQEAVCIKGNFGPRLDEDCLPVGLTLPELSDHGLEHQGLLHANLTDDLILAKRAKIADGIPFVGLTFQSLCHHIRGECRPAVLFLSKQSGQFSDEEKKMLGALNETCVGMWSELIATFKEPLFWLSSSESSEGMEAIHILGSQTTQNPQVLLVSPSLRGSIKPTIIETFEDVSDLQAYFLEALKRSKETVEVAELHQKQLEEERNLKRKQENDLVLSEKADALKKKENKEGQKIKSGQNVSKTQKKENKEGQKIKSGQNVSKKKENKEGQKIKSGQNVSKVTVHQDTSETTEVKVFTPSGQLKSNFSKGGLYQEVYDWLKSQEDQPAHFVLERKVTKEVVSQKDNIPPSGEAVILVEKTEKEMAAIMIAAEEVLYQETDPVNKGQNQRVDLTVSDGENDAMEEKKKRKKQKGEMSGKKRKREGLPEREKKKTKTNEQNKHKEVSFGGTVPDTEGQNFTVESVGEDYHTKEKETQQKQNGEETKEKNGGEGKRGLDESKQKQKSKKDKHKVSFGRTVPETQGQNSTVELVGEDYHTKEKETQQKQNGEETKEKNGGEGKRGLDESKQKQKSKKDKYKVSFERTVPETQGQNSTVELVGEDYHTKEKETQQKQNGEETKEKNGGEGKRGLDESKQKQKSKKDKHKEMLQPNASNEGEENKKKEEEESLREKKAEYEDKDERKNEEGENKELPLSKRQKRRQKEKERKMAKSS
ncbi:uncharacterized protein LOC144645104 isoform X2 [Oculina patagonica]